MYDAATRNARTLGTMTVIVTFYANVPRFALKWQYLISRPGPPFERAGETETVAVKRHRRLETQLVLRL
ncbi:hypothetical protein BC826DRAFT_988601 [Russula brevipes]|nr:hypothetical protein BC826DRAFT_988601 [Russula brevipes]